MLITTEKKKENFPVFEMKDRGRLIIPNEVIAQVNYLHGKIGSTEWSGLLLYDVISGSPAKPKDFVLEVKHIFLMDIGTSAYTEYNTDGDIVEIYDNIEEAMNWKTGQIHTHHTMQAFFSGTDMEELNDNVDKHNYYLSLIVNFSANYAAKVAFLSDIHTSSKLNYMDDSGNKKYFKFADFEKRMVIVNMDIYYKYKNKFFYDRYNNLIRKKEEEKEKEPKSYYYKKTDYEQGSTSFDRKKIKIDADPKSLTNQEVEKLARNVFSVTPDLSETRSVYQILHVIGNSNKNEIEFYWEHLSQNIELTIENFFDQHLEIDEMIEVISDLEGSLIRFSNYPMIKDVVDGIIEILREFIAFYKKREEEDQIEEQLEEELLKTKMQLQRTYE